jgi:hypothetical protein
MKKLWLPVRMSMKIAFLFGRIDDLMSRYLAQWIEISQSRKANNRRNIDSTGPLKRLGLSENRTKNKQNYETKSVDTHRCSRGAICFSGIGG